VDLFRKLLLRRGLCGKAEAGPAYVPFIGDGDIAAEVYAGRLICGADLDPDRVASAQGRFPDGDIRVADCDGYPFADRTDLSFAIADFDSYSNPYKSLEAFWTQARTADRVVLFGTDGHRQTIKRRRSRIILPAGAAEPFDGWREIYNFWWPRYVRPHLESLFAPAVIVEESHYYRGADMLYWGVVVDRTGNGLPQETGDKDPLVLVEAALFEAAVSGNVPAMVLWLERQDRRDTERRLDAWVKANPSRNST